MRRSWKGPLFAKAGAIIPMYRQVNYDGEHRDDTFTSDIYPFKLTQTVAFIYWDAFTYI